MSGGVRARSLRVALLAATCLVASLVAAALTLPVVGGAGLAAKAAADHFTRLPDDLPDPELAQRTILLDDTGHVLAQLHGAEDRIVVPTPAGLPTVMKQAIVAIEDSRFYEHHGVDFQGVVRALVRNGQAGETQQGASTITQQYVKNVLEETAHTDAERKAATADTASRKLQEARYALEVERRYPKDEILRRYLNIANFGDGVYGAGTAAEHYFHTTLSRITVAQAALLAGIVNSPELYDPFTHPDAARQRRDLVLSRMVALHDITPAQQAQARQVPMPTRPRAGKAPADACERTSAPFFCFYVRDRLEHDRALGDTQAERDHALYDGGLRIQTTLDPKVQAALQAAVDALMPPSGSTYAVIAAVQPGTGKVLGIAANKTYSSKPGPTTTKLGYLGYRTTFQGGSTFKLFTLAAALSAGIPRSTSFPSPACYRPKSADYDLPGPLGACPHGFQNSDPAEAGTYDMVTGTWFSVNTYFIQLEQQVGVQQVIDEAEAMGINRADFTTPQFIGSRSLSVTLGAVNGVSPLEEAVAYATVAAHGRGCRAAPVVSVTDAAKQPVPVSERPACRQVLSPSVADEISGILQGVLTERGATAAGKGLAGRPAAGKTGTLDEQKAAWFSGFTPQIAASVVLGNPANTKASLGTVADVNPAYAGTAEGASPLFGGTLPADIWQRAMDGALAGAPVEPLPPPVYGAPVVPLGPVPGLSGPTTGGMPAPTASGAPAPGKGTKGGKPAKGGTAKGGTTKSGAGKGGTPKH